MSTNLEQKSLHASLMCAIKFQQKVFKRHEIRPSGQGIPRLQMFSYAFFNAPVRFDRPNFFPLDSTLLISPSGSIRPRDHKSFAYSSRIEVGYLYKIFLW